METSLEIDLYWSNCVEYEADMSNFTPACGQHLYCTWQHAETRLEANTEMLVETDRISMDHIDSHTFPPLKYIVITYCECLVKLKDVNITHGQAGTFQDFRCSVRWPKIIKQRKHGGRISLLFFLIVLKTIKKPPSNQIYWVRSSNSPQKQLIFGVLRHIDKVSARIKYLNKHIVQSSIIIEVIVNLPRRQGLDTWGRL